MSLRRTICSICRESFKITDENIYSTTCGHLFHFECLREWQRRSPSCAQCRSHNPETHKICLSFEDEPMVVDTSELNSLKTQLSSVTIKMHDIQDKLTQSETKRKNLMVQYTTMDQLNRTLQQEIKLLHESDNNFLELQAQYTEKEECINALMKELTNIKTQLIATATELNLKNLEFETMKSLKTENLYGLSPASSSSLPWFDSFDCEMLEEKLQNLTEELNKENLNIDISSKKQVTQNKSNQNKTMQNQETRRYADRFEVNIAAPWNDTAQGLQFNFLTAAEKLPNIDDDIIKKLYIEDYIEDEDDMTVTYTESERRRLRENMVGCGCKPAGADNIYEEPQNKRGFLAFFKKLILCYFYIIWVKFYQKKSY